MVITCPECSTRFKLADERIPDTGAKLRCARCRHVFMVHKPVLENPFAAPEEEVGTDTFAAQVGEDQTEQVSDSNVDPFYHARDTMPDDPPDFSEEDPNTGEFNYDRFRELDNNASADEEFTFGGEEDPPAPSSADVEPFSAPAENIADLAEEQEEAKELASSPAKKKKTSPAPGSSAFSMLIKALLLIILAALIAGGIYIYLDGPNAINDKLKQYFGQTTQETPGIDQISLGPLEGRFLRNEQAGEIFLIRGEVVNNFSQSRSAIQVKGVLYDPLGKPLLQKTVFCGNPISDEQLRTLPFEELEQIMGNQFGKDLSNMKVDPRKKIPFDIVFKDLPANIAEFSVNVTSSRPPER